MRRRRRLKGTSTASTPYRPASISPGLIHICYCTFCIVPPFLAFDTQYFREHREGRSDCLQFASESQYFIKIGLWRSLHFSCQIPARTFPGLSRSYCGIRSRMTISSAAWWYIKNRYLKFRLFRVHARPTLCHEHGRNNVTRRNGVEEIMRSKSPITTSEFYQLSGARLPLSQCWTWFSDSRC